MTDIVERLRDPDPWQAPFLGLRQMHLEAADAIEQRDKEIERLNRTVISWLTEERDELANKICNYCGEIARLKAELDQTRRHLDEVASRDPLTVMGKQWGRKRC